MSANHVGKYHHGRTPAAWTGMAIAMLGSFVAVAGFVMNINWMLVWVGLGILVLAPIVGGIMVKMGMGQDWETE